MLSTLVLYLSAAALGALSGAKGLFPDTTLESVSTEGATRKRNLSGSDTGLRLCVTQLYYA